MRHAPSLAALAAIALAALAGPARAEDARVTILDAARAPDSVSLALCGRDGNGCEDFGIDRDTAEEVAVSPGLHVLRVAAGGTALDTIRFGAAPGDRYALMLYGLAEQPVVTGWWSRARAALGGVEARRVNGYQLAHLIVPLTPGEPGARPQLRLANLVPGLGTVSAMVHQDMHAVPLAPTKYGAASPKATARLGAAHVAVSIDGASAPLAEMDLDLAPGSTHILAVTGLTEDGSARLVHLVSRPPDRPG